jgi:hypothetical protein
MEPTCMDMVEFGTITLTHELQMVNLNCHFARPVVILGALSYNGGDPSTVRAKDIMSNSFKVQIQEWDYLDGPHTTE